MPRPMGIIVEINHKIAALEEKKKEIQDKYCFHPVLEKTNKSSTGNYDPSAGIDFYCPTCEKRWSEDQ